MRRPIVLATLLSVLVGTGMIWAALTWAALRSPTSGAEGPSYGVAGRSYT